MYRCYGIRDIFVFHSSDFIGVLTDIFSPYRTGIRIFEISKKLC